MDRQDIDALLVGALYGELTPAEEARLAAHLEAHPADRGALDDLKSARAQVRESRIFQEATEPPQHISALLLQEAHRRAPKRAVATEADKESSWFFRFTRMFLAHPAMAAAAMLVLVVGVAGTLYSKKGSDFGSRTAPSQAMETAPAGQDVATADPTAGSAAFSAQLADERDLAEGAKQQVAAAEEESAADRWEKSPEADKPAIGKPKAETPRRRVDAIAVTTEQQQPKELERSKDAKTATSATKGAAVKADAMRDYDGADDSVAQTTTATTTPSAGYAGGRGAASGGAPAANSGMAQPPPPPSAPADNFAAAPKAPAPEAKPSTVAKAPPTTSTAPAQSQESTLIAWARTQHASVAAKVKAGDCQAAAKLALTISTRAPDYYSQYMATDRQLKSCKQYIDAERDKEAERANKTRAQKRVNADESAPSPSTK